MTKAQRVVSIILLIGIALLVTLRVAAQTSKIEPVATVVANTTTRQHITVKAPVAPVIKPKVPQKSGGGVVKSPISSGGVSTGPPNGDPAVPILLQWIGYCESGNHQFRDDGVTVKVSRTGDIGKYQINAQAHLTQAIKMGIDLNTEAGNTAFALLVYDAQGSGPWKSSRYCWGQYDTPANR